MNLYKQYILPRIINRSMRQEKNSQEREELIPRATGIVLEVGFGSGLNLPFYGRGVAKLYALDPSDGLWKLAKDRLSQIHFPVEFIPVSAEKIPLADNSIDSIVMTWCLCSVADPAQVLKELHRVLRANGRLLFIEHGRSPRKIISQWQIWLTPLWKLLAGGCHLDRPVERDRKSVV